MILAGLGSAAAVAAPPDEETLWQLAPQGESAWQAESGAAGQAIVSAYPSDCIGVSDRPHESRHNPG